MTHRIMIGLDLWLVGLFHLFQIDILLSGSVGVRNRVLSPRKELEKDGDDFVRDHKVYFLYCITAH